MATLDTRKSPVSGPYALGDLLGSLTYLGQCAWCRQQFMSVRDVVFIATSGEHVCKRCVAQQRRDAMPVGKG